MAEGYPRGIFGGLAVNPKHVCDICDLIIRNPVQRFCGHTYCKNCVERVKLPDTNDIDCPSCKKENVDAQIEDEPTENQVLIFPDNALRKEMLKLPVVCTMCDWSGIFKDFEEHFKEHASAATICPCGCGLELEPGLDINQHAIDNIASHLLALYARLRPLEDASRRRTNDAAMSNTSLQPHVQQQLETLIRRLDDLSVVNVSDLMTRLSAGGGGGKTTGVTTGGGPTQSTESTQQKMVVLQKCIVLLNNEVDKLTKMCNSDRLEQTKMNDTIESVDRRLRAVERAVGMKDVVIADLKTKLLAMESANYDGSMIWVITDVKTRRREALSGQTTSVYSPPFFTSRTGYKMCLRAYFNGDGSGKTTHFSLFFVVMRGQYDALLRWPFRQRVNLLLLNQDNKENIQDAFRPDPSSSSFKRPTSDMNIASGCPTFAPVSVIESETAGFVKDDRLFIKVVVDITDLPS